MGEAEARAEATGPGGEAHDPGRVPGELGGRAGDAEALARPEGGLERRAKGSAGLEGLSRRVGRGEAAGLSQ